MAFPCFAPLHSILLHLSSSSSSSSSSLFPIPQTLSHFKLNAHNLTTHNLHSSSYSEEEHQQHPQSETLNSESDTKKKKRRRKLRPNFYAQTLDRWSLKVPSERSRFPWQKDDHSPAGNASAKGSILRNTQSRFGADLQNPGNNLGFDEKLSVEKLDFGNARSRFGPGLRNPERIGADLQNPEKDLGFGESSGRNSLDLSVEKLDFGNAQLRFGPGLQNSERDLGFDENSARNTNGKEDELALGSASSAIPLGIRKGLAPWVHGGKARELHLDEENHGDSLEYNSSKSIRSDELSNANGKERACSSNIVTSMTEKDSGNTDNLSDSLDHVNSNPSPNANFSDAKDEEIASSGPTTSTNKTPQKNEIPKKNYVTDSLLTRMETPSSGESGKSRVSLIIDRLKNSAPETSETSAIGSFWSKRDDGGRASKSGSDNLTGAVPFPWERSNDREQLHRSNTKVAESTIPELELRRLRNIALRMKERTKVGHAGVTEAVVGNIHKKWKEVEVVKLQFEGPPALNMKRTHEILERKTGGLVIWRSGSSVVLYRGMAYELPCVQSYSRLATASDHESVPSSTNSTDSIDVDNLLDQLGPRYKDWTGCNPLPVDADLLPGIVSGYKPPYRLLPYKTRSSLKDRQMTSLRRLARTMSPHFALGRNRQHQGLARAVVKLWERSAIVKIAIKRGVRNTCNERMAEEIKKLTGGVLVSRNKEYIVFYRGNDYLTPSVRDVLMEKQKLATVVHDEEEAARLRASALVVSDAITSKGPLLAGTLAETLEANTHWGNQPSAEDREKMKKDLALAKHASDVRYLERKLDFAKAKVRKAERALAKVQEFLVPAELPTDLETITDEERFLFRNMGLKMRSFIVLGRREVFDGTVENMHLSWKHRELVKILVKGKSFPQVKHIAISLEAESGGVLISLDKTTKGYAIVIYRGKNYSRPIILRPRNLLTRRQALARSIELQRREALKHHILGLQKRIEMLKSQLDAVESAEKSDSENFNFKVEDDTYHSDDDDMEDEGEEAYLRTYGSGDEEDDASIEN